MCSLVIYQISKLTLVVAQAPLVCAKHTKKGGKFFTSFKQCFKRENDNWQYEAIYAQ